MLETVIRSAIVPVAGYGTRLLPATKSQPKEMLPVARKPIVQYVAEELAANGIDQVLFVTGRNKTSIENHFDLDPELNRLLQENKKTDLLSELQFEEDIKAKYFYTRQRVQRGLGDAIFCGENFAGEQPFVVALGDSILGMNGRSRTLSKMVDLFERRGASCVIAVEEVPRDEVQNYGVIDPAPEGEDDGVLRVVNLIEKPAAAEAPSNLAIAGRYVFSPLIFDLIRQVAPDKRGEIQLTNAIQRLCEEGRRVLAVKLPPGEKRYDIGNFPSYFETFVEFALADPAYGPGLRLKLEELLQRPATEVNPLLAAK
jgi:UTP--glucose-1-phosphate uridylyltransferase